MFSITTIELSMSRPTPSARPPRLMMLSDTPVACSSAKVAMIEIGMASAMAIG